MSKQKEKFAKYVADQSESKDGTKLDRVVEASLRIGYANGIMNKFINDILYDHKPNQTELFFAICQMANGIELIAQQYGKSIYDVINLEMTKLENDDKPNPMTS